tara:strand:- start:322 stop:627 length:306 start_codon:yes stop_codon:yes gene_type:complete
MTQIRFKENFCGVECEIQIRKNGDHSGSILVLTGDQVVIDNLNFTTSMELSTALQRAQVAILTRANKSATTKSALIVGPVQDFIKNSTDYLKKLGKEHMGD